MRRGLRDGARRPRLPTPCDRQEREVPARPPPRAAMPTGSDLPALDSRAQAQESRAGRSESEGFHDRPQRPVEPQRPAQAARAGSGAARAPSTPRRPRATSRCRRRRRRSGRPLRAGATVTFWCQQCMPLDRVGLHREGQVLVDAGLVPPDALGVGVGALERPDPLLAARKRKVPPSRRTLDERARPAWRRRRRGTGASGRRGASSATTPGWMPSVTQTRSDEVADARRDARQVAVRRAPSAASVLGWTHSGFVCEISWSHLALPERVWISVGRRKVGRSTRSPALESSSRQCTCERDVARRRVARRSPTRPCVGE